MKRVVYFIGLVGSLITIYAFISGYPTLGSVFYTQIPDPHILPLPPKDIPDKSIGGSIGGANKEEKKPDPSNYPYIQIKKKAPNVDEIPSAKQIQSSVPELSIKILPSQGLLDEFIIGNIKQKLQQLNYVEVKQVTVAILEPISVGSFNMNGHHRFYGDVNIEISILFSDNLNQSKECKDRFVYTEKINDEALKKRALSKAIATAFQGDKNNEL